MGEGSLLLRALHEHRDRRPNALIDEHHENLALVAKENRAAAAHRGYGADLYFDNGFTHIANLVTRLPVKIRFADLSLFYVQSDGWIAQTQINCILAVK